MSQLSNLASPSPALDSSSGDAQRQSLLQYIDQRIQELEEERQELRQQASDLEAERRIIVAKMAEAEAAQQNDEGS
ncbi:hypothetical protein ABL78_5405 [Leptomonas seymouri]|uniref:Uncharacterized protein n=1 Tax=Leptomonas seymouri TaxID=5684 RepID=A0A0N1IJB0_LEPSE|nr:hypothetical protein ABL78_5405 [Leptomonas seymouri]|eukprot:KPI85524.1 hypothetical protein ABL78_5405 [Leptomonas seymouri]